MEAAPPHRHLPGPRRTRSVRRTVGVWWCDLGHFECLLPCRRRPRRSTSPAVVHWPEAGAPNVRSILKNATAVVDPHQWPQHPLPWRNTPSGGENHVTDANGTRVYDGPDGAEMFRLYAGAAQAAALLDTDRTRRRGAKAKREPRAGLAARSTGCRTADKAEGTSSTGRAGLRESPRTPHHATAPTAMRTQLRRASGR